MSVIVVLEYLYNEQDEDRFIATYKANLLPYLRTARGMRHVQLVSRTKMHDHALFLIEFNEAMDWEHCKAHAPPKAFPREQDKVSEELLYGMPNTAFPLAHARQRG